MSIASTLFLLPPLGPLLPGPFKLARDLNGTSLEFSTTVPPRPRSLIVWTERSLSGASLFGTMAALEGWPAQGPTSGTFVAGGQSHCGQTREPHPEPGVMASGAPGPDAAAQLCAGFSFWTFSTPIRPPRQRPPSALSLSGCMPSRSCPPCSPAPLHPSELVGQQCGHTMI